MTDPLRLLLLDDDPLYLRAVSRMLSKRFSVSATTDPDEALELVANERFDAVISDFEMPGTKGDAFLERVRLISPGVRRILASGSTSVDAYALMRAETIHRFLAKPFLLDEVERCLADTSTWFDIPDITPTPA